MKPEPEIYKLLLSKYNLALSETVYINDLAANIGTTKLEGLHGIVFKLPESKKKLSKLSIEFKEH